jgi:integrase/recombinase XerD
MGRKTRVISNVIKRTPRDGIAVQEAANEYLQTAHVKRLGDRTREEYIYELGEFASWCGSRAMVQDRKTKAWTAVPVDDDGDLAPIFLHEVNDQVVHCYLEYIKATHKPKKGNEISDTTLGGYVRVVKTFLNWCLLDEEYSKQVQAIVIKRIKEPKIEEKVLETFTQKHIEALFEACQQEESEHLQLRDEAILAVLLDTGLRAEELVTLTIGHVSTDPRDAFVKVHGKGDKWGEVGLGERARKAVAKYIRMFREPTIEHELHQANPKLNDRQLQQLLKQELPQRTVFMNRYAKQLKPNGLYQIFDRLGEWAAISPDEVRCSPHTCRHTFAANFIRQGGDIYTLSKLMRHSSVKVTEEYLKSLKQSEARRRAKSVLDNL